MIHGLIDQKNVQHHAFVDALQSKGHFKSKLERIRRFFAEQDIDYGLFAKTLVLSMFQRIPDMHLILDRTNWKFGKKDINYLVLVGRVGSVTFPLFWMLLEHQGCSHCEQRKALLEQFKDTFGLSCIASFTADREFIGKDWLAYLEDQNIPFLSALRIIDWSNGDKASAR
jgi:hypothetical protein